MFRTVAAKALLGAGALAVVGGSTALAATPNSTTTPNTQQARPQKPLAKNLAAGTIIKLSDKEMTVERVGRDKKTAAVTKDDQTLELNAQTVVYRAGDKTHQLGLDALKVGQDVRIRFALANGQKVARAIVIMPDRRVGRIVSKDADGKSFTIHIKDSQSVHVTTSDKTRFVEGLGKSKKTGAYADLKVGDRVAVLGLEDGQHNFDAALVRSANADHQAKPKATTKTN